MSALSNQERIEKIYKAQDLLRQASNLISEATRGTSQEERTKSYITSHIDICIDSDHYYSTFAPNLETIIENLNNEDS